MTLRTANGRDAVYTFDGDGNAIAWYGSPELLGNPLIPGTKDPNDPNDAGVKLLGGVRAGDAGVVLIEAARRFHLRVRAAVQAEGWWGYNFRTVRGGDGSTLSNHSGGWAIDCASGVFFQGRRTMTGEERAECAAIEAQLEVIRWGGWWTGGSSDEMHFEIREKVADGDITRVANQIRAGSPAPRKPTPQEEDMAHFIYPSDASWPIKGKAKPVFKVEAGVARWMQNPSILSDNQKKQIELGQTAEQVKERESNNIYQYFGALVGPAPDGFDKSFPRVGTVPA